METYFKLKTIFEWVIPLAIIGIIFVIWMINVIISSIRDSRINKFFEANGYIRKLFDVPSVGNGAFYGWVRESDNKRVDDRTIKYMSLKDIKSKYK